MIMIKLHPLACAALDYSQASSTLAESRARLSLDRTHVRHSLNCTLVRCLLNHARALDICWITGMRATLADYHPHVHNARWITGARMGHSLNCLWRSLNRTLAGLRTQFIGSYVARDTCWIAGWNARHLLNRKRARFMLNYTWAHNASWITLACEAATFAKSYAQACRRATLSESHACNVRWIACLLNHPRARNA